MGALIFRAIAALGTAALRAVMLGFFRVRVHGLHHIPRYGPAIICGNHPSLIDGLLLYLVCPATLRFIAHRELFRHPLIGWVMRGLGFINARHRKTALHEAEDALRRGELVVIFPEGGAYDQGRMEEMHQGAGLLAIRTGAPVVHLGIAGSAEAFPLGTLLPRPRRIEMRLASPIRYVSRAQEVVPADVLVVVLMEMRDRILAVGRRARGDLMQPLPADPLRPLRVLASGAVLLPMVAMMTLFAHDMERPPPPE